MLHGNTYDYVRSQAGDKGIVGTAEFLAEQLFGRWSLVLHYDLGRGLRVAAGRNEQRLKEMVALANRKVGDLQRTLQGAERGDRPSGSLRAQQPDGCRGRPPERRGDRGSGVMRVPRRETPAVSSPQASSQLVTLLNWATSPHM